MAITYEWKITALKKQDIQNLENVIVHCRWKLTGTDENGNTGEFQGATPLPLKTLDPNNFTPFEQLTETLVVSWLQQIVDLNHPYERIQKQIDAKKNPTTELSETELPWAPPGATTTTATPNI